VSDDTCHILARTSINRELNHHKIKIHENPFSGLSGGFIRADGWTDGRSDFSTLSTVIPSQTDKTLVQSGVFLK
jgi:hypothetical protein